jgi:hypothetical protein
MHDPPVTGISRGRLIVLGDLLGIGLVAALLTAVHVFLPSGLQGEFVFRQSLVRPETLLTAAYLHADTQHLLNNLAGYAAVALYTYILCLAAGQRRWFWLTTLTMLTVVPVLVNLSSMVAWELAHAGSIPPSRGFSGVVAAYGGFLAIALLGALRQAYSRLTVYYVGQFLLLVVLGELLVIYADSPPLIGGALVLLGIVLVGAGMIRHAYPEGIPRNSDDRVSLVGAGLEVMLVVLMLSLLVYGLFPTELVAGDSLTNVFAHLSGLVWGTILSRWGYRYWRLD